MGASDEDSLINLDEDATLYEVLGVTPDCDETTLRRAYKKQALRWHPDKCTEPDAEQTFKRISAAFQVLSNEAQRAQYDHELAYGDRHYASNMHTRHSSYADEAAAQRAWQEFLWAEERERAAQARKQRRCWYGLLGLVLWGGLLLLLLRLVVPADSALLFPPPLELTNTELAKMPLDLDFKRFSDRLVTRHRARAPHAVGAMASLGGVGAALEKVGLLRTHTPYLRLLINRSSEVRVAPEGITPKRTWLLVSKSGGEDIYGRSVSLVSNTLMHMVERPPSPWPAKALCARLLKSGPIRQKEWWSDMSRAVGGRLRPFALAIVPASECEPDTGIVALGVATAAAVGATSFTLRRLGL